MLLMKKELVTKYLKHFNKLTIKTIFAIAFAFSLMFLVYEIGGISYSNDLVRKAKEIAEITKSVSHY